MILTIKILVKKIVMVLMIQMKKILKKRSGDSYNEDSVKGNSDDSDKNNLMKKFKCIKLNL